MKEYKFDSDIPADNAEIILGNMHGYNRVVHMGSCETHLLSDTYDVNISGGGISIQRRDKKDLSDADMKHCDYLRTKLEVKSEPLPEFKPEQENKQTISQKRS